MTTVIGVLALQGAFAEHQAILTRLSKQILDIQIITVRTVEELTLCSALVIPGGESTTIALLAKLAGLLEPLREFVKVKPVWGTCAGAILLAEAVEGSKQGGQDTLGGVSVRVGRNGFGSQIESFEASLLIDEQLREPNVDFIGVFIRAPIILGFLPADDSRPIQILARLPIEAVPHLPDAQSSLPDDPRTIVAVRQGPHLLTTFHPELTRDDRFHEYFVRECVLKTSNCAS